MIQSIKIPSSVNNIADIEYFFNTIFINYKIPRKIYCKIYLAATEAVNNAILHGNLNNPEKLVSLHFNEINDQYLIEVIDQGKGFDYTNVSNPREPANIRNESGRGIFIMMAYADEVVFNELGNSVQLIFNK